MRRVQPAESVNSLLGCNLHASVDGAVEISAQEVLSASDFRAGCLAFQESER
jgi:hypothetical protein